MKSLIVALVLSIGFAAGAAQFKTMTASELQSNLSKKENIQIFDANTENVRKQFGIIAGATKLSNSSNYEATVLPKDKNTKVVFYCYNEMCTASHNAAKHAMELGYPNAYVMKDGITGWISKKFAIQH